MADDYNDRFLMGEVDGDNDTAMQVSNVFTSHGRLHATYNFDMLEWGGLTVNEIKVAISNAVKVFNGTGRISFAFSNHDVPRVASRQLKALGLSPEHGDSMQLLLLKLETCLIGSSCMYQGEELGLEDAINIPLERLQDPWGLEFAPSFLGRDSCRTPMVWNSNELNGGFSSAREGERAAPKKRPTSAKGSAPSFSCIIRGPRTHPEIRSTPRNATTARRFPSQNVPGTFTRPRPCL